MYVLRSGEKRRERDMERMETQTNNYYSISTEYGFKSRELDERCKGYVTLLLAWRPLAKSNLARVYSTIHNRYAKVQGKTEEKGRKERGTAYSFSLLTLSSAPTTITTAT